MTNREHCQCKAGCPFVADEGHPYCLPHDPRPERAEARAQEAVERSKRAGLASGRARAATAKASERGARLALKDAIAEQERFDNADQIKTYLALLATAAKTKAIPPSQINAGVKAATAAHDVLARQLDVKAEELRKLAEELEQLRASREGEGVQ